MRDTFKGQVSAGTLWLLLALTLTGCNSSPLQGRYYKGFAWLEFRNGVVTHGELGDSIGYRVEGSKIILSGSAGTIEGQIVDPSTVSFKTGTGALAEAFAGVWTVRNNSGTDLLEGAAASAAAAPLLGQWRIVGETDVFEFRPDGRTLGARTSPAPIEC